MKSIFSGFVMILFAIIIFTSFTILGTEMDSTNLDSKSTQVLQVINSTLVNDINVDELTERDLINGTNDQDKTSFGFEFQKASSDADKKISVINTIKKGPAIVVASTGANSNDFREYITIAEWFIGIMLSLILFDAIFTRRVFNK